MVRLKTVLKSFSKSKDDPMKDKVKLPKEKKLKPSKSLIDVSIFRDRKKGKRKEQDRLVVSSWDVSAGASVSRGRESWSLDTVSEESHKKGHLRRSSSVDNLSLYSVSRASVQPTVSEVCSASSSRSPSTVTCPQDSSDDSISTGTTATVGLVENRRSLSQSTPAISPSISPKSQNLSKHKYLRSRTKKFLRRFPKVEASERVLDYYACALVADILLQGTLFITDNYFAFHSNIFGYVSKILIPISQVTNLQKEKTAKFIPNAIRVQTENEKTYVFSSLLSRESTFKLMMFSWRKAQKMLPVSDDDNTYIVKQVTEVFEEDSGSVSAEDSFPEDDMPDEDENSISHEAREDHLVSNGTKLAASAALSSSMPSQLASSSSEATTIDASYRLKGQQPQLDMPTSKTVAKGRPAPKLNAHLDRQSRKMSNERQLHRSSNEERQSFSSGDSQTRLTTITSIMLAPFRLVMSGLSSLTVLCEQSVVSAASSFLVILLLISAAFMLHRVEELGKQMATGEVSLRGDLYEEVLHMQQKLHSVLATDVEKNIDTQLKQLATVRESLESLMYMFKEQSPEPSNIDESTVTPDTVVS